jgi:hypothetical protein
LRARAQFGRRNRRLQALISRSDNDFAGLLD